MKSEIVVKQEWYEKLLNDLKKLAIETIVKTKHEIGKRILMDEDKFDRREYGSKKIDNLAQDMGISRTDLYYCVQFVKKYPELSNTVGQLSWRNIIKEKLPIEPKEKSDHPEWQRFSTVWNFSDKGEFEGASNLPTDMVKNVIHYYSKEGDLVGDPFAGSGMTKFVCDQLNRKSINSDINPSEDWIMKKDIRHRLAKEFHSCSLIFLDPPYWNMVDYGEDSLDKISFKDFIDAMDSLAINIKNHVNDNVKVALVIMPIHKDDKFYDLGFECFQVFQKHLKVIERFCVPVVKQPHPTKEGSFISTLRDLIIFEKK